MPTLQVSAPVGQNFLAKRLVTHQWVRWPYCIERRLSLYWSLFCL